MTVFETHLPRDPTCAYRARRLVGEFDSGLDEEARADAALAVGELVNNAYVHGRGRISLRLERTPSGLRVQVSDEGAPFAKPRRGMGLRIVDAIAEAWGLSGDRAGAWLELGRLSVPD